MMDPAEFAAARASLGLGRREFGKLLGYTGNPRNIYATVRRYEEGIRYIPPAVAQKVRALTENLNETQDHQRLHRPP